MQKETVAIRLEPETVIKIKRLAEADKRTVSDYLRLWIEGKF